MGTYVHASIAYGFTVAEPEIDWDAGYDESGQPADDDACDAWEIVRDIPGINCDSTADSQWDDRAQFIYVKSSRVYVGEDAVLAFDPGEAAEPGDGERANLAAARSRVPSRMNVGPMSWHLYWSRG